MSSEKRAVCVLVGVGKGVNFIIALALPGFGKCQTDSNKSVWPHGGHQAGACRAAADCLVCVEHGSASAVAGGSAVKSHTD